MNFAQKMLIPLPLDQTPETNLISDQELKSILNRDLSQKWKTVINLKRGINKRAAAAVINNTSGMNTMEVATPFENEALRNTFH